MQKCTNRFFIRVNEMKRIISCALCLLFIFGFTSCDEINEISRIEKTVAVKYSSGNELAVEEYVLQGFTKVTYNSSADVVLSVENKKSDYGILDDFEFISFTSAGRNIKKLETCDYSPEYCAYFNAGNKSLKEAFNKAIGDLKNDGILEKIKNAHLKGERFSSSVKVNENGTLVMLCDPSFENRVYTDEDGNVVGLDVDIAYEICNYLGYDLEIVTADFDELFIKLNEGDGDFIMSACEVNEERAEYYLLSDTYFTLNYHLIERE